MSLLDWIKGALGLTRKRDISRLEASADALGSTSASGDLREVVDLTGGPLKEHHRRRALRDKRLLPKNKPITRQLGLTKPKKIMSLQEGARLFGATMRNRNRNLRDLLPDEQQLKLYGLPVWRTEEDLARALGISLRELWFFAIHREREQQPHYVTFAIPKRSGGERLIMAPKRRLKAIQRALLGLLVEKLPVSDCAHAFRRRRSIRTGAEPHVAKRSLLKLDLKNFFPTVTAARVRGLLIAYGYGYPVATTLAVLMTEAERQPVQVDGKMFHVPIGPRHCVQGAPTSPGICNALLLRFDRRLAGLARKHGFAYTRYADDLTFSSAADASAARKLRVAIARIVREEGFIVNADKTRLMGRGTRQTVTGVVVNQVLGLSRQERRRLRATAHQLRTQGAAADPRLESFTGKLAYLEMLNPQQAAKIRDHFEKP
jgi:RNA-directed DNA polymerase